MKSGLFIVTVIAGVFFAGCSRALITLDHGSFSVCRETTKLNSPGEFLNETADNITATVQGDKMTINFDVRKKTESNLSYAVKQEKNQIRIFVSATPGTIQEVCMVTASVVVKNVSSGKYDILVMNGDGKLLLANKDGVEVK